MHLKTAQMAEQEKPTPFKAIYLPPTGSPTIREIPQPYTPKGSQTLIKVSHSAINPGDLRHFYMGLNSFIMGYDYTGTAIAAGPDSPFKPGDAVLGMTFPGHERELHQGAHQAFLLADPYLTFRRPEALEPLSAVGMVSPVQTAADAIFNLLGIGFPPAGVGGDDATGRAILIWGGSSGLGWACIQLAKAAGFGEIFTTASAKNHAALRGIGATHVFDYHDADVVQQIKDTAKGAGITLCMAIDAVSVGLGIFEPLREGDKARIEADFEKSTPAMTKRALSDGVVERGEVKLVSALPVVQDPDYELVLFSRKWPGEEEKHPGWWQRQEKVVTWFIENHETTWKPLPVKVVDGSEEAVVAVRGVFEGRYSFVKVVLKHPLV